MAVFAGIVNTSCIHGVRFAGMHGVRRDRPRVKQDTGEAGGEWPERRYSIPRVSILACVTCVSAPSHCLAV